MLWKLEIKNKQNQGKFCVLGLGTGASLTPVYTELARRHKENGLSFKNVVVFNAYEYFPLKEDSQQSSINFLHARFLDHVDIEKQNVFSFDGTIAQGNVISIANFMRSAYALSAVLM
jgi:glucosamine-6-phosphate deaminase